MLGRPLADRQRRWAETSLADLQPQAVIFDSVFLDVATPPGSARLVLAHDVISQRASSFRDAGYSVEPADVDAEWERRRLLSFGTVVAIQWDDAAELRRLLPDRDVVVAPPAFDAIRQPAATSGRTCLLVGSGARHNVDGASWFLRQVWPEISRCVPDATLEVVGTLCSQLSTDHPSVTLHGEVDSLAGFYARARAVVVPLRVGSGLKVKLVEALCHGRPVVTTPVGAQGFGAGSDLPFLRADDAAAFADCTIRVLTDDDVAVELATSAVGASRRFTEPDAHAQLVKALHDGR